MTALIASPDTALGGERAPRRILIAGATGTNGRALIDALDGRQNVTIRALVRDAGKADFPDSVEVVHGDLAEPRSIAAAFDGVDKAFVVIAIRPDTTSLFTNFFDAAKAAGVGHLVKFSGLGASTESPSEVIRQHGASDAALRASGLPHTILRPNSFHQNMLGQADNIAREGRFYLPLAEARQSMIDVRDIAQITAAILLSDDHDGKVYDLTGPESLSFHDVAQIIGAVRGKPVEYVPVTSQAMEATLKSGGMPDWNARALAEIQALFATGDYANVLPDAERLLGSKPRTFRQFAEDYADAWR